MAEPVLRQPVPTQMFLPQNNVVRRIIGQTAYKFKTGHVTNRDHVYAYKLPSMFQFAQL